MADLGALHGKDVIWKYRILKDKATSDAWGLAYTTSNGYSKSSDSDSVATKDGSIVIPGAMEVTASTETNYKIGDESIEKMEDAFDNGERIEVWRINTKEAGTGEGKFKGRYWQGIITSFEEEDTAEDLVTYSLEFALEGAGKKGDCTLDLAAEADNDYSFTDTVKAGA